MLVPNSPDPERRPVQKLISTAVSQLLQVNRLTKAALARELTEEAVRRGVSRRGSDKEVRYDTATVTRWVDGSQAISRQAAWLLDQLHPNPIAESFQDLRDRYLLETDREQVPRSVAVDNRLLLENAKCTADVVARQRPKRELEVSAEERIAWIFASVVDSEESRGVVDRLVTPLDEVRIIAQYELLGRWDLGIKLAISATLNLDTFVDELYKSLIVAEMVEASEESPDLSGVVSARRREFTACRSFIAENSNYPYGGGREPARPIKFLILPNSDEYDTLRVQRAFLFIELRTVAPPRRPMALSTVRDHLFAAPPECQNIVEAMTYGEDAVVLELLMTCADRSRLNELSRILAPSFTKYHAQRYNLLVYFSDESGGFLTK